MSRRMFMRSILLSFATIAVLWSEACQNVSYGVVTKIMPLGDSITAGYTPTGGIPGGYR